MSNSKYGIEKRHGEQLDQTQNEQIQMQTQKQLQAISLEN